MKVHIAEVITDKNGRKRVVTHTEDREPGHPEREERICQWCVHGFYPRCKEGCPNFNKKERAKS